MVFSLPGQPRSVNGKSTMSYWQGKKVGVTGGAGMVGSRLVELLLEEGAQVLVLDNSSRGRNRVQGATYLQLDVSGYQVGEVAFYRGLDAVFNLAAWVAGVIYNQSNHLEMFDRNIRLLTAPLMAAQEAGVKDFLQVSSVCIYAPENLTPSRESKGQEGKPTIANEGYSWAKRMGEHAARWSTIPHVVTVRPSNIYGPRDHFDERAHVIPALIRKCLEEDVVTVNGTGDEYREFLYVRDAAKGMMHALEHGDNKEVYNLGTNGDTCIPIRVLVKMIQQTLGMERKAVNFVSEHNPGDDKRWSDCSKIQALGWRHEVGLEEGLDQTVQWYLAQTRQVAIT